MARGGRLVDELDLPAVAIPACMTAIKKRREFKQNLLEAGEEA